MPCYYHRDREPVTVCVECGRLICSECTRGEGGENVCRPCVELLRSAPEPGPRVSTRKSPVLAVLLSVIPGVGQIYNEQVAKGLLIMAVFFALVMLFLWGGVAVSGAFGLGYSPVPYYQWWPFGPGPFVGHPSFALPRYRSLALVFLILLVYCYAIFDAATVASRTNRGESISHRPRRLRRSSIAAGPTDDDLRKGAEKAMTTPILNSSAGQQIESGAKPPPRRPGRGTQMARLGWALVVLGLILLGQMANIWWLRIERVWPIIPLLLGLRFLYDYRQSQDSHQLLLGLIFTLLGGYFLLDTTFRLHRIVGTAANYWPVCLLAFGIYLIWRNRTKPKEDFDQDQLKKGDE